MIRLSRLANHHREIILSETIDASVSTRSIKLPRHISSRESASYRQYRESTKTDRAAKTCNLDVHSLEATNLAVNILRYQLSDRIQQKHLDNLRNSLEKRLTVAKLTGNRELVSILQEEFKQLSAKI